MSDYAADLRSAAFHALYQSTFEGAQAIREVLRGAKLFEWTTQALAASQRAAETFPHDSILQPSDVIMPIQFWVLPFHQVDPMLPGKIGMQDSARLVFDDGKALNIIRFHRVRLQNGSEHPALVCGAAFWPYHVPYMKNAGTLPKVGFPWAPGVPVGVSPEREQELHEETCSLLVLSAATQFWLKSTVAVTTSMSLSRPARRRVSREGFHPHEATVVTYRLAEPTGSAADREAHEYSCRWLVQSHWRKQFMPASGTHRPTLIAEHMKGPADKPLVIREKRYRVSR